MGRRTNRNHNLLNPKSHTLPSSPTHSFSSSSSSDFEFTISVSPRKSSTALCPADELFYKGQLLPLHLSPRLSMVRTLLLASSSTSSSSDTTTTASRDSTGSSNDSQYSSSFSSHDLLHHLLPHDCDSSRPSSVTEDDEFKRVHNLHNNNNPIKKANKYFSLSRFSSVFRKEPNAKGSTTTAAAAPPAAPSSVKRMSTTAKEVIRKYLKKVKPLYEKLSQNQNQKQQKMASSRMVSSANVTLCMRAPADHGSGKSGGDNNNKESLLQNATIAHSFSGNLRYPRRRSCVSSCPSSMRSSPSHSGVLSRNGYGSGFITPPASKASTSGGACMYNSDASSMEELQSAIQGAIAHCKKSMLQSNNNNNVITTTVSNEIQEN